jgi:dihydroxy-acid dehydratase
MVRISDGRMSGTAFGTVVLHVAPEAAAGGALGVIQHGDLITLDVPNGILHVELTDEELQRRQNQRGAGDELVSRGYVRLFQQHVQQAHLGADFDFLRGGSGSEVVRDSH